MTGKMPQEGEFCWNELMTGNTTAAKEFYCTLFGWECEEMPCGPNMTYTMFKTKDKNLGGMMAIPEDKKFIPPHWLTYISVNDVNATLKKAESLGATTLVPVTPVNDFGLFAVVKDPTGASIAFWQSLKACT